MSDNNINNNISKSIESSKIELKNSKSNENLKNNNQTIYNNPKSPSEYLKKNNPTINIVNRNILSINNSNFEHLRKVKSQSTIYQIDKKGNNYLDPIYGFSFINNEMKENQKRNNINSLAWLNIIKNKLFSIDINSKVKKGENISRSQFYEQKKKIIISPGKILKNNNKLNDNKVINSYKYINKDVLKINGLDYKFNSASSMDNIFSCNRFKINSEPLNSKKMNIKEYFGNNKNNIDYWKKIRLSKNNSLDMSFDKESSPQKLKSNFLYFDKNHEGVIRHKNWWKIDP